jgi:hypothetical protein
MVRADGGTSLGKLVQSQRTPVLRPASAVTKCPNRWSNGPSRWSSASSLCCLSWVWSTREPKKNKLGTVRHSGTDSGTGSVFTNCAFLARLEMELNSGQSWFLPRRQENVEALDRPWSKQMVIWASAPHIIEVCKQTFH